jgi:3-dehydroquinate synthetase
MTSPRITELSTCLEHPAPYYLGDGVVDLLGAYLRRHTFDRVVLVTTAPLMERFGDELVAAVRAYDLTLPVVLIPDGEIYKNWETLTSLCDRLVAIGVTRESVLLALGGGVVGNVVGLAAGLIFRGIRYVEVPTTLMAQTDGVLSNKQAVNGRLGKNHFGMYHAPLFVWADVAYVRREPPRQTRSAVVEGIKNGLVNDAAWLDRLEDQLRRGPEWTAAHLREFVLGLIESKLAILRIDPSEKREAVILEYGHTFGHAIEWICRGTLHHGEAVSIGMCAAAELSHALGLASREVVDLHYHLLGDVLGAPVRLPVGVDPQRIVRTMLSDNKRKGSGVSCLLLEVPGRLHNPGGDFLVEVREDDALLALVQDTTPVVAA